MRCPVHVAVDMEVAVADRPHFAVAGGDDDEKRASRQRRFCRCPVIGCRQVSQIFLDEVQPPPRRKCILCGINDADPYIAARGDYRCRECARLRKDHSAAQIRLKRAGARGSLASTAARLHRRGQHPNSRKNLAAEPRKRGEAQRGVARLPVGAGRTGSGKAAA